jgi:hypothetical protein
VTLNPQLIQRVDVEGLLIDALTAWLVTQGWDIPVSDELAAGERTESVAVFRTGGVMDGLTIDSPTIAVEAKGITKTRSSALINLVSAWLHGLAGFELDIYGVTRVLEFSGPALLPVADSPTRYTQTFSLEIQAAIV